MRWRKYIDFDVIHLLVGAIAGMGLSSCQPEMPVISTITVEADGLTVPVNPDLYGLTIEEINHGIDGGLYAELIQNRSFEDGVPPLNCPYDAARNVLITPNGWTIPFMRGDSVPGWRRIVPNTQIYPDMKELVNDKNRRSLLVAVSASGESGRGGVIAEAYVYGYGGCAECGLDDHGRYLRRVLAGCGIPLPGGYVEGTEERAETGLGGAGRFLGSSFYPFPRRQFRGGVYGGHVPYLEGDAGRYLGA